MADFQRYYQRPGVKVSLTVLLSILLIILFLLTAIKPTFETIVKLRKSIETAEATLAKLKAKEMAVQKAASIYERISSRTEYVVASLPTSGPEYEKYIKTVEFVAERTGVIVSNENLGGAILYSEIYDPYSGKGRKVVKMPISIKVSGPYQNTLDFLNQLNNVDRVLEIENLSISTEARNSRDANGNVSLSISGFIAYIADEEVVNKAINRKEK